MYFLVFLALVGCSAGDVINPARDGNVALRAMSPNPYMMMHTDDGHPITIEYFRTIVRETGLMVRVSFSDESGPLHAADGNETILNICDILDRALFEPESTEARYNMASSFGMTNSTCPIEVGVRIIPMNEYTIELTTMDFGDGEGFYIMTVEIEDSTEEAENRTMEMENQTLFNEAVMEVQVNFELTRRNETCTENSSVVLSTPTIAASIVTALIAITFAR